MAVLKNTTIYSKIKFLSLTILKTSDISLLLEKECLHSYWHMILNCGLSKIDSYRNESIATLHRAAFKNIVKTLR